MIIENSAKVFEKPDSGMFLGTIIDFIDLGKVPTKFGLKTKIRIVWVLDKNDSEGNPYRVIYQANASMNEKAKLYEQVKSILGQAPAAPFDSEVLIGRSNQLYVAKEKDPITGNEFANIKLIAPLPSGSVPPPIPQGFVRAKDRQQQVAPQSGTTAVAQQTQPVTQAQSAVPQSSGPTVTSKPFVDAAF